MKRKACGAAYDRFHDKNMVVNGDLQLALRSFYAGWDAAKRDTRKRKK
jgi:hypothetical protein